MGSPDEAIREDKPYNEAAEEPKRAWSRPWAAWPCHTGQIVTCDQMLARDHEFAPDVDKLTMDSPAPLWPARMVNTPSRSRA